MAIIKKKDYGQTYQNTQKAQNNVGTAKTSQSSLPYGSKGTAQQVKPASATAAGNPSTASRSPSPSQGRQGFTFNINEDALYKQYADAYARQAKAAAQNTQAQAQAATGGYGSSYAATAANQSYNNAMLGLSDYYNTAYQNAYARYRDEMADRQWQQQFDYGKTRDTVADRQWQQQFDYGKERDTVADTQWETSRQDDLNQLAVENALNRDKLTEQQKQADIANQQWQQSFDYGKTRDTVADQQWQKEFDYGKTRDTVADKQWNQSFDYNKSQDAIDNAYRQAQADIANQQWQKEFDYGKTRDTAADKQWQQSFDYGKTRDTVADKQWQQSFDYNKSQDAIDNAYRQAQANIANQQWQKEFDYGKTRDTAADKQWQQSFNYNKSQDAIENQLARDKFTEQQNQAALDEAYRQMTFDYGKERDLKADEQWNQSRLDDLAQLGIENTLNRDKLNEQIRQYNNSLAEEQRQFNRSDEQWKSEYDENQRQYNESLAEEQRQYDKSFGEDKRQYNESLKEEQRQYDKSFGENQRQYDKSFGEDQRQYNKSLAEEQRQYDKSFGENQRQYNKSFAEEQRQYDKSFGEDQRQYNKSLAEEQRQYDKSFGENKRQYDESLKEEQRQFDRSDEQWKSEYDLDKGRLDEQIAQNKADNAYREAQAKLAEEQWNKTYAHNNQQDNLDQLYRAAVAAAEYGNFDMLEEYTGGNYSSAESAYKAKIQAQELAAQASALGIKSDQLDYLLTLAQNGNYGPAEAAGLDTTLLRQFNQSDLQKQALNNALTQEQIKYYGANAANSGYGGSAAPTASGLYSDDELRGSNISSGSANKGWANGYNPTNGVYGDYNNDGKTTAADAQLLLSWAGGKNLDSMPVGVNATEAAARKLLSQTAGLDGGLPKNSTPTANKTSSTAKSASASSTASTAKTTSGTAKTATSGTKTKTNRNSDFSATPGGPAIVPSPGGSTSSSGSKSSSSSGSKSTSSSGSKSTSSSGSKSSSSSRSKSTSSSSAKKTTSSGGRAVEGATTKDDYTYYYKAADELAGVPENSPKWKEVKEKYRKYGVTSDAILHSLLK